MRKITFPHMGNLKIPVRALLQELGLEVVAPPDNSKKTLDLGVKYSPEFACLPLKINLGNFIEAMEMGADTIIMGGGVGPCRFGYYGEVQREILEELGYEFEMIVLEPDLIQDYRNIKRLVGRLSWKQFYNAGKLAWVKTLAMDEIERHVLLNRGREKTRGEVDRLYQNFLTTLDYTMSVEEIDRLKEDYLGQITGCCTQDKQDPDITIGIIGEIYLVIEPFVNLRVEEKLGRLGVSVLKEVYISTWMMHFLHLENDMKLITEAATPYLNHFVGGHGIDSVGNTVRFAREGIDGIIQLAPFTCMPEIIAQTILPEVSKGEEVPVLSLFFDEHSGEAGLITRLEAFIDLIARNKRVESENNLINLAELRRSKKDAEVLSGN